jgi:hypothetical protein
MDDVVLQKAIVEGTLERAPFENILGFVYKHLILLFAKRTGTAVSGINLSLC